MISRVVFENFKALKSAAVDLEQFTVFVGPNGSGKTSILEGLSFVEIYGNPKNTREQPEIEWLDRFGRGSPNDFFSISFTFDQRSVRKLIFRPPTSPSPSAKWTVELGPQSFVPPRTKLLRLSPRKLAMPTVPNETDPQMREDGTGLASYLARLKLSDSPVFDKVAQHLRELVPSIDSIKIDRVRRNGIEALFPLVPGELPHISGSVYEVLLATLQAPPRNRSLPANMLSEGTLLLLGMLAVLLGPDRPQLLLIDDMDRALHPRVQVEFVKLLKKLLTSDEFKNVQIVGTTHSPYMLDGLDPSQVRLTALNDLGNVAIARLSDHPEFEAWKESMLPGEMWSYFGEKWITELPTTAAVS